MADCRSVRVYIFSVPDVALVCLLCARYLIRITLTRRLLVQFLPILLGLCRVKAYEDLWSNYGPVILTKDAKSDFGSHPCRMFSINYE